MAETETLTIFLEKRPRRNVGTFRDRLETETSRPRPQPWIIIIIIIIIITSSSFSRWCEHAHWTARHEVHLQLHCLFCGHKVFKLVYYFLTSTTWTYGCLRTVIVNNMELPHCDCANSILVAGPGAGAQISLSLPRRSFA